MNGKYEDEELCPEPKPETVAQCNNRPCESKQQLSVNSWNYGEWSKVHLNYLSHISYTFFIISLEHTHTSG